ncbi:MAG: AI-2E family transporter [Clostridia bacterium]|nr:AI-2E family transporter [Clostridia bacterium]
MKRFGSILSKRSGFYAIIIIALLLLFVLFDRTDVIKNTFSSVWNIISPVVIGIVVAYLFNPVSNFFEKTAFKKVKKDSSRHLWGVVLTIVCFVLIVALLLLALIPSLVKSITRLISNWDVYTTKLEGLVARFSTFAAAHNLNIDFSSVESLIDNSMERLLDFFKNNYKNILQKAGEIGTGISNYAIGIVFGFCFLMAKTTILNVVKTVRRAIFKENVLNRHNDVLERCHKVFIRYVGCTLLDALIIGVATFIFNILTGVPYSPLIAVVVAVTNIVPTFGPMIGAVIGVFFIILESPIKALIFLIFIIVLQSLDGMVIKPRLFSGSLGIPAVWTLVMIIFSGRVAGVMGIILSIPLLAIFEIIYKETIVPHLDKRAEAINAVEE